MTTPNTQDPTSPVPPSDAPILPAAEPKSALWEDFIDVFYAPSAVFRRRSDGRFGLALFMFIVLMITILILSKPLLDPAYEAEFARSTALQQAANPEMVIPAEQRDMMLRFSGWMYVGGAAFGVPIMILLTGLALWLVGMGLGARQTFSQAMMVATYANVPRLLQQVLNAAQAAFMDPGSLVSVHSVGMSPARFMDPDVVSPGMIMIASRFDLFTIWVTVLLAIGLSVTGGVSRMKGAVGALIVWVLGTLVVSGMALRSPGPR